MWDGLSLRVLVPAGVLLSCCFPNHTKAQVSGSLLSTAVQTSLYMQASGGASTRTGLAYNPVQDLYYSVVGGSAGSSYPVETFNSSGVQVSSASSTIDHRGLWYNTLLDQLEANAWGGDVNAGVRLMTLDGSFYATGAQTAIFGSNQPDWQSCGHFDPYNNEIIYPNGSGTGVRRVDRDDNSTIQNLALTGTPGGSTMNTFYIFYTGVIGMEYAQFDYVNKRLLLYDRSTGAYAGTCSMPASFPSFVSTVRLAYTNDLFWVFNTGNSRWESYKIFEFAPGPGYSPSFDGTNDYVATNTDFNLDNQSFSIEFWCKRDVVSSDDYVIWQGTGSNNAGLHIGFRANDQFTFAFWGNDLNAAASYTDTYWHHWAVTYNASTNARKIYRDGMLIASDVAPADYSGTGNLEIGRVNGGNYFDGSIDEVRIWQTELSQAQVRDWMCKKLTSTHTANASLLGHYRFDEGAGTTTANEEAVTTPATFTNGPTWIYSGASIGDESRHDYSGTIETGIAGNTGDSIHVSSYTGTPSGTQVYYVNTGPLETAANANIQALLASTGYYGVFTVEGTSPTYTPTFYYGSNATIAAQENKLVIAKRADNSGTTWSRTTGRVKTNTTANTVNVSAQSGTEYAFAYDSYPSRPGSGYTLQFDGVNEGVSVPLLTTVTDNFTLEGWVNPTSFAGSNRILFHNGSTSTSGWGLYCTSAGVLRVLYGGVTSGTTSATLSANKWSHVALVRSSGTTTVYVNGVSVYSAALATPNTPATGFWIGQNNLATENFNGLIDEVRVWNTALSQTLIQQWMCTKLNGTHTNITNLLACYRFDEASGSTLYDIAGTSDGTLNNMETGDWVLSGAPLGDASVYNYTSPYTVSYTGTANDALSLSGMTGTPNGVHLYFVGETPNSTTVSNATSLQGSSYYGVFVAGGTSPTYDLSFSYGSNASLSAIENTLVVTSRANNAGTTWARVTNSLTKNTTANTIGLYDQSGTEYHFGSHTAYPGRPGSGYTLDFDGVNDHVAIPDDNSIDFSYDQDFTVETWIYAAATQNTTTNVDNDFIEKWTGASGYPYVFRYIRTSGTVFAGRFDGTNISGVNGSESINDGQWHHVAFVKSGSTLSLFVDGVADGTATDVTTGTTTNSSPLYLGARNGSENNFTGNLDEVRIWNKALSLTTLRDWMCKKVTTSHPDVVNLRAYYRFDDATGTALVDLAGGNDGTMTNMDAGTDWEVSGAAIGDASAYAYSATPSLSLAFADGSTVTANGFTNTPAGAHLYTVNEAPINQGLPTGYSSLETSHYFGVFTVNGTNPAYDLLYDYASNANINGAVAETRAALLKRTTAAQATWQTTPFLTDSLNNDIYNCQDTSVREFIAGFSDTIILQAAAIAKDTQVYINAGGYALITAAHLDDGSFDQCGIDSMWIDADSFYCADIGTQQVVLHMQNTYGMQFTDTADVLVIDTIPPVTVAHQTLTLYLDNTGQVALPAIDADSGSSDNCSIVTYELAKFPPVYTDPSYTQLGTYNYNRYYLSNNTSSWAAASTQAQGTGGYLTTIGDGTENAEVVAFLSGSEAWIGFNDITTEGTFEWVNGEPITYTNWGGGEPNDAGGNEDCTHFRTDGFWNDLPCGGVPRLHVIEVADTLNYADTLLFDCADADTTVVALRVTDAIGLSTYDTFNIILLDTVSPQIAAPAATVYLDANGSYTVDTADFSVLASDNCAVSNQWSSPQSFHCADTSGVQQVTFYAEDARGNIDSVTVTVTVLDTVAPELVLNSDTLYLDSNGSLAIDENTLAPNAVFGTLYFTGTTGNDIYAADLGAPGAPVLLYGNAAAGSSGPVGIEYSPTNDSLYFGGGNHQAVYRAAVDGSGVETLSSTSGMCCEHHDLSVDPDSNRIFFTAGSSNYLYKANLDGTGVASAIYDAGSSYVLSVQYDRNSNKLYLAELFGTEQISVINADGTGHTTLFDATDGVAGPRELALDTINQKIYWVNRTNSNIMCGNMDGTGSTTVVYSSQSGIYGIDVHAPSGGLYWTRFGGTDYIMRGDVNGISTPETLYSGNFGSVRGISASALYTNIIKAGDNCAVSAVNVSPAVLGCTDTGAQVITVTVTDLSGNATQDTVTVMVLDTIVPDARSRNFTAYLDASGQVIVHADSVDSNSYDNCALTLWLSDSVFTCADTGANGVTFYARDPGGNTDSSSAVITVADSIAPQAVSQNLTVYLDSTGNVSIVTAAINNGSLDNCAIDTLYLDIYSFDCSDAGNAVPVVLTVKDFSGNTDTSAAYVTVLDTVAPEVIPRDITIYLDSAGFASITAAGIDSASWDSCGIDSLYLDIYNFSCANVGPNTVTLFADDVNGNTWSQTATVTVLDTIAPVVIPHNITVYLDSAGTYTLTPAETDSASWDSCGIASSAVDTSTFSCANVGTPLLVTLTLTDVNGNVNSAAATVTVVDTIAPEVVPQNITVYLDSSGSVSFTAADIESASWDSCGIDSLYLDIYGFSCANVGPNTVTLFADDVNGNTGSQTATVTVLDTIAPGVIPHNITVYLDSSGAVSITAADIDSASWDSCGIDSLYLDIYSFSCADIGPNTVTLSADDINGNTWSQTAVVTVFDTIAPEVIPHNISVYLDSFGTVAITAADVDSASWDSCGIDTLYLDIYNFSCANVGPNTVTLFADDVNGNTWSQIATVTVLDTIAPKVIPQNITVYLDSAGAVSITAAGMDSASWDSCGIDTLYLDIYNFSCANVGPNTVTLFADDVNGNTGSQTATVTVLDTIAPEVIPHNIVVYLDSAGTYTLIPAEIDSASWDSCGIASSAVDTSTFSCANVGTPLLVTLTLTDVNGNVNSAAATVTVLDTIAPEVVPRNITVYLDSTGSVSFTAVDVDSASWDSCGIDTLYLDIYGFSCGEVGPNTVTLFADDVNGNTWSQTATVTVLDTIDPKVIPQNITVYLDSFGAVSITAADADSASWDSCGIDSLYLDIYSFSCADIGPNTVTLFADDINGNTSSQTATVTVFDTIAPEVIPQNITVYLDSFGAVSITAADVDSASWDSCGIDSLYLDIYGFSCADIGPNTVTLFADDVNGNTWSQTATVTVLDTIAPKVIPQNITVYLDSFGSVAITAADVDSASWDSCGIDTLYLDIYGFSCGEVGPNTVTLFADDVNGNTGLQTATVTVIDTIAPEVVPHNITVYLDSSGAVSITAADVDSASWDSCGIDSLYLDIYNFSCADLGLNTVTLFADDVNGNTSSQTATVTVFDTIAPAVIPHNITVYLDSSGTTVITAADVDSASWDSCGIDTLYLDIYNFSCANVGPNTVTLFADDVNGNTSSQTAIVTVFDTIAPEVIPHNITVYLDSSGVIAITAADIDSASWDSCGIDSLYLDIYGFSCANVGPNTVTLFADDVNGNTSSQTATVTVLDTIAPEVIPHNITVYLDSSGTVAITAADVDSASWDSCGIDSLYLDIYSFSCTDIGPNTVTLFADDVNGNTWSQTATVTVLDTVAPEVIPHNITVYLDSTGAVAITAADIDSASWDSCGIDTLYLDIYNFSCANVGPNTVTLFADDVNGNTGSQSATVTVLDTIAPEVIPHNITVYLDSFGAVSITAADVDSASWDSCSIDSLYLDIYNFSCADLGLNTVTLFADDINGNTSSQTAIVTVFDTIAPEVIPHNITVYLDSFGVAAITAADVDSASWDSCGIDTLYLDIYNFSCASVGPNTVTLFADDVNGNTWSQTATVTVLDTVAPEVIPHNITVYLDSSGTVAITAADIDSASWDSCGIDSLYLDIYSFSCANIGPNTVTLFADDVNGNTWSQTATVTVLDTVAPEVIPHNITVYLDSSGTVAITAADVDSASWDSCGIDSLYLDIYSFSCANIGPNTVTLFADDVNGNTWSQTAVVTVLDTVAPEVIPHNITVYLDSFGSVSITAADIDSASWDSCGIDTLYLDIYNLSCANVGPNTVTLFADDVNGNTWSQTATVTVLDTVAPEVIPHNITVYLDSFGTVAITAAGVDSASWDSCGIDSLYLDIYGFSCADIGPNTVTLFADDINGNTWSQTAVVTVLDTVAPEVIPHNITVYLDSTGAVAITAADIDSASWDSCGIDTLYLDIYNFFCANVGPNTVTLFADDVNGNTWSQTATVTVLDTVAPEVIPHNITVYLDSFGAVSITAAGVDSASWDSCGIDSLYLDIYNFSCADIGPNTVTLFADDINGNTSSQTAIVTVFDTIAPKVIPHNITVYLDSFGVVAITAADVDSASWDSCGIDSLYLDIYGFSCASVGPNTVTLFADDVNGNTWSQTATVTVLDTVAPEVIPHNITVYLDSFGAVSITAADIDSASWDSCGIDSLYLDIYGFSCANIGPNTVTLFADDINGNTSSQTATVTVFDTIAPEVIPHNITVYLDSFGSVSITAADVDSASWDSCGIDTLYLDIYSFSCAEVGPNSVTLFADDVNGNTWSQTATVTVLDTIAPEVLPHNITVYLDSAGAVAITAADIDSASWDSCGIDTLYLDIYNFSCANVGPNTVTLFADDVNGNTWSQTATVTVLDTVAPEVIPHNITVYLDSFGAVAITAADVDSASWDSCSIDSLYLDIYNFSCANVGPNTVTLFADDVNGNTSSQTAIVTVFDTIAPEAIPHNITVYLDSFGAVAITAADIDSASWDSCGIDTLYLDIYNFSCANVGPNTVTLFADDVNGNTWSQTATVTVLDTVAPEVIPHNITVYLDSFGAVSITAADIDSASWDSCGIGSLYLDIYGFSCANIGPNTVTLFADDVNGNTWSQTATVTVLDTVAPEVIPHNITVYLDSFGVVAITAADVDSASWDSCGIDSLYLDIYGFSCADIGPNTVTLFADDVNGNTSSQTATVTVLDTIAPEVIPHNITVYLDSFGSVSITAAEIDSASWDSCGIDTLYLDIYNLSCANVGPNTVTLFADDVNGNTWSQTATVNVLDTVAPEVIPHNITVYLDSFGAVSITAADVDSASWDSCGIDSLYLDIYSFSCADIGPNTVTLFADDINGNTSSQTATVTVFDTIAPEVLPHNITVYLDSFGTVAITAADLDSASWDSCGIDTLYLDIYSFTCTDTATLQTVTLFARDIHNNLSSHTAFVTVLDTLPPVVITQNLNIYLDTVGQVMITPADVNNGSADNCAIDTLWLSNDSFGCGDTALVHTVTLYARDFSGNIDSATAQINVFDTTSPTVSTQNLVVYLDSTGFVNIFPGQVDSSSLDNCGIDSAWLSQSVFDCSYVGDTAVIYLFIRDMSGNMAADSANVVVLDSIAPEVITQDITVYLDSFGTVSITPAMIDNGSWDSCGIDSIYLDNYDYSCANVGSNTVILFADDVHGNTWSQTATVTVVDTIAPAIVIQNLVVYLDSFGAASITADSLNTGSWDSCGIASIVIDTAQFTCANHGDTLTVTFTATDIHGNVSTDSATVIILDTLPPKVLAHSADVYLDAAGQFVLDAQNLDDGTFDNCSVASIHLSDSAYTCADADSVLDIWFVATDTFGNADSITVTITVHDTIAPLLLCPANIVVNNDPGQCGAIVDFNWPAGSDNCSIDTVIQIDTTGLDSGMFFPVGITTLRYVAFDPSGNTDTCSFTVEVQDTEIPVLFCISDTAICDSTFTFTIPAYTDNCGGLAVIQIAGIESGEFFPVGVTVNTFAVQDQYGNADTCSFEVLRYDFPSAADAGADQQHCETFDVTLTGNTPAVGLGTWSIVSGSGTVQNINGPNTTLSGIPYGFTLVEWSIGNGVCPAERDTVAIEILQNITIADAGPDQVLCETSETELGALPQAFGTGTWINLNSGSVIEDTLAAATNLSGLEIASYSYVWKVEYGACPVKYDTVVVTNAPYPVVTVSEDEFLFPPSAVNLTVTSDIPVSFEWTPAVTTNDDGSVVVARPAETTVYYVTGTSDLGCSSVDTVTVIVNVDLEIPTAFTPDGDGHNDVWNIKELDNYPGCHVAVYNRWGNLIFESENYDQPWDGTYKGDPLPSGAYFYVINLNAGLITPLTGSITIIK